MSSSATSPNPIKMTKSKKRLRGSKRSNKTLKKEILMNDLNRFYDDADNFQILVDFVNQQSKVSLRALEFLCKKMAPERGLTTKSKNGQQVNFFGLYSDYGLHGKRCFDPFRRYQELKFSFTKHGQTIITTLAQLRFFKYAIQNNVILYAREHAREIEDSMKQAKKQEDKTGGDESKKRKSADDEPVQISQQPPLKKARKSEKATSALFVPHASSGGVTLSFLRSQKTD